VAGSNRGLTLAAELPAGGPLYLPEGASDTAALLAVGACAVGRPMAVPTGWVERWLLELLHERPPDRPVIVVGDNDGDVAKTPAGLRGAEDLARRLGTAFPGQVSVALPPAQFKDVRAMVIAGAWGRGLVQKGGGA
jgi:hypothetical protein